MEVKRHSDSIMCDIPDKGLDISALACIVQKERRYSVARTNGARHLTIFDLGRGRSWRGEGFLTSMILERGRLLDFHADHQENHERTFPMIKNTFQNTFHQGKKLHDYVPLNSTTDA